MLTNYVDYMNKLNQAHITIKFTHEISETELTFLDITLYKGNIPKQANPGYTHPYKTH